MKAKKPARRVMKRKTAKASARRVVIKRATVRAAKTSESIRIVPLHYPKPTYALEDLVSADSATADTDLFDGKPHLAPADALLTYRGGPLLQNVQVFTVFWGTLWKSSTSAAGLITQINGFFQDILVSPLIDQLAEYNTATQKIGHGTLVGSSPTGLRPTRSPHRGRIHSILYIWTRASCPSWVAPNPVRVTAAITAMWGPCTTL